jgi:hypothetical protein
VFIQLVSEGATTEPDDGAQALHHNEMVATYAAFMPTASQLSPAVATGATRAHHHPNNNNKWPSAAPEQNHQEGLKFLDGLPENIRFRHRKQSSKPLRKRMKSSSDQNTTGHEHTEVSVSVNDSISPDNNDNGKDERCQLEWAALLHERPLLDNHEGMPTWLQQVLAVSDPAAPYKPKTLSVTSS